MQLAKMNPVSPERIQRVYIPSSNQLDTEAATAQSRFHNTLWRGNMDGDENSIVAAERFRYDSSQKFMSYPPYSFGMARNF